MMVVTSIHAIQEVEVSRTTRWTIGMTVLGLTSGAIAFAATGSWVWGLVAMLGAGIVANSIASARAPRRSG